MCDCIDEVTKKLREKLGDDELELKNVVWCVGKQGFYQKLVCHFKYRKKTKTGDFCKGKTESYLHYNYCPFCGEKIKRDTEEK